jgi:C1A family cysteine protease
MKPSEGLAATTGHSTVLVGCDDARSAFRLMNSFGRTWGDSGYAWSGWALWRKQVAIGFVIITK